MKIFSFIRRQMTPLFALRYLFLERPNRKEPAMSRKIQFAFLFLLLAPLSTAAQSGSAPIVSGKNPLKFGNNFLVTGDYVVAGAYNMSTSFVNVGTTTYAKGTIRIPDVDNRGNPNPGITGATLVPKGAQIVAALLYWQTAEKIGLTPGGPGTGQIGFFRPVFNVPPPNGQLAPYQINGVPLSLHDTVGFSSGGCSGTSTGKALQSYRADVRNFLPRDKDGNVLVNSTDGVTFEVRLPSTGSTTPITLGATLVLIYRVLSSPDPLSPSFVPLNSIVIYDGLFASNNTSLDMLNMSQTVKGFDDAATTVSSKVPKPVSRFTHIAGGGKSNKLQNVYLNGIHNGTPSVPVQQLPSLYGTGQSAFPAWYGTWDNPTWTLTPKSYNTGLGIPIPANPLNEDDDSATIQIKPTASSPGCVSSSAMIFSTTVRDDDFDGILKAWKEANPKGYTDVGTGQFVPLTDAQSGQKDVFIQLDHVVDVDSNGNVIPNGDFTPKPGVEDIVKAAFLANNHNIHLHITDKNTILEPPCDDASLASLTPPQLCPYPNQPGITTWPDGFEFLKNQLINTTTGPVCGSNNTNCLPRFPIAQRNSHHYVVFGDTLGAANWGILGGTLLDATGVGGGGGVVSQVGNDVTFYMSRGHGLVKSPSLGNGRVTITGAITNLSLNGTYRVTEVSCPTNPEAGKDACAVDNKALGTYMFKITILGNPTVFDYTRFTDPNLAVASGLAGTGSGFSHIAGSGTLVTLGKWGTKNNVRSQSGTFTHELGHTLGLQHGGGDSNNCKSNYLSVMNYMFQTALLGPNGVVDFSSQQLDILNENNLGNIKTGSLLPPIAFPTTSWYDTKQTFVSATITSFAIASNGVVTFQAVNGFAPGDKVKIAGLTIGTYLNGQVLTVIATGLSGTQFEANSTNAPVSSTADSGAAVKALGSAATHHCDGPPLTSNDPTTYFYEGGTTPFPSELDIPWSTTMLDANFDGKIQTTDFRGYNDWANTDFRQVGATGSVLLGPGGLFTGPGGLFTGPGGLFTGPGGLFTGPGGLFTGPGTSGGEIDLATAISVVHAPGALTATEDPSPRVIHLSWTAPTFFDKFNIYKSSDNGASFSFFTSTTDTFKDDPVTCNPNGYKYFVTVVALNTTLTPPQNQESTPSNTAPTTTPPRLTGCYTNTPNTFPTPPLTDLAFSTNTNPTVQGDHVFITWTLQVDNPASYENPSVTYVSNKAANTLSAIGPFPNNQGCGLSVPAGTQVTKLLSEGAVQKQSSTDASAFDFNNSTNQFTFTWDTTPFNAGCYLFKLDLDSKTQSETTGTPPNTATALTLLIFVSDNVPHMITTSLPDGVVGSAYPNTTLQEAGGIGPTFTWCVVVPGSCVNSVSPLPPGISLGLHSGTLSGAPTAPGIYSFVVKVTDDSTGNFGTQTLTLRVADALFGDLIVVDGSPSANPLAGTLFRITPTGTWGTIAPILDGNPTGVAVDPSTGNLFVSVAPVLLSGTLSGTPRIVEVTRFGTVSDFVPCCILTHPVAVAVDNSGNVYIGDNSTDAIYKFTPSGMQVNGSGAPTLSPFASLPASPSNSQDIRMAVDNASNLIVGSDTIHDVSGTVEVDKIDSSGNVTVLYTNPTLTYSLTAASAASGGTTTTYAGTFSPTIPANSVVNISGFTNGVNNGQFTVVSCTSTQLVVNNPAGTAESNPGTATFQLTPASGTVTLTDSLTAASAASAGTTTTYTGTFSPTIPANSVVNISGFTMSGNNGQFTVVSCTSTQLVVNNPAGVAENNQSTATFQLTAPIGTVGGIAVFADGSIDVADFGAKSIFKITNPGTQSMAITTAVNGPAISPTALCCDISGMANPPSATNTTSLYVTLNGLSNGPQLQLAVPAETPSVTTVPSGAPLTFPKDVAWANLAPLPQPPKNLSAATAAASVVLTWNASPSNNVAYNVYRATVSVGPFTKLTPVPTTSLTFTDPVSSGTTYYYVVTAVGANSSLESAYSNEVSARRP